MKRWVEIEVPNKEYSDMRAMNLINNHMYSLQLSGVIVDWTWDVDKREQPRVMFQDDGIRTYDCSSTSCGYDGDSYCQNCGYAREEK